MNIGWKRTSGRAGRRTRRVGIGIAAALVTSFTLAACGGGSDEAAAEGLTKVRLNLSWVDQAEYAGWYIADKKGYFEEEGIDIEITPGGPDVNTMQILEAGTVDVAMNSYGAQLAAREQGADLVTVAPAFERSANILVYFADNPELADPKNWKGKKVSLWTGWNATFAATLGKNGLSLDDVEVSNQSFDMTNFVKEGVDLADAMVYNEWAQAIAGAGGRELAYFDYNADGTALLEQNLVVKRSYLEENPELIQGFLKASMKGWIDAREDPQYGVDTTLEIGTALPEKFQNWQINEINKLIWPSTAGLFTVPDEQWQRNEDILFDYGVIKEKVVHDEAVDMSLRDNAAAELEAEGFDLTGADFTPQEIDPYTYFKD